MCCRVVIKPPLTVHAHRSGAAHACAWGHGRPCSQRRPATPAAPPAGQAAVLPGPERGVELVAGDVFQYATLPRALGGCNALLIATGTRAALDPFGPYNVDFQARLPAADLASPILLAAGDLTCLEMQLTLRAA